MKLILFSIICLGISLQNIGGTPYDGSTNVRFSSNSIIYQLFEMFRKIMVIGDADNNVPKTDPFTFDVDRFKLAGLIQGEVNITNGVLSGLGKFQLGNFEFSKEDLVLDVELTIPVLKFEADDYEMKGSIIDGIPLAGSGIIYFVAKNIVLNTKIYLKQSNDGKSVLIDHLEDTHFTVSKIVSLTQFDKNIDHIFNAIIEDFLATKLSKFSRYIAATYQDNLVATVNPVLGLYETWNTLAMIL